MTAAPPAPVRAPLERAAVFWRSMLLQAGWNFEGMQNLGFLFAIEPGLRRVYGDGERRRRALLRHLGFFNSQPHMTGFALGACLALEEDAARAPDEGAHAAAVERLARLKRALGSALAALGDPFFWGTLKPATAAFTLLAWTGLWTIGFPAPFFWGTLAGLVLFNAPALWARWAGLRLGHELGEDLPAGLKRLGWREKARVVRAAGLAGAAVLALAALAVPPLGGAPSPWHPLLLAGAFGLRVNGVPALKTYLAAALIGAAASAGGL